MCDEWLTEIIRKATARVGCKYFRLPIAEGVPIYRERVYCYELYHQMRCWWPTNTPFYLNGEVNKVGHEILKNLETDKVTPDFLVHWPGDMERNHTIIEVKSPNAENDGIRKDLETLSRFTSEDVDYKYAIYLIYGYEADSVAERVIGIAGEVQEFELKPIELWLHKKPGESAEYRITL